MVVMDLSRGTALRLARHRSRLTQRAAARAIGVTQQTISEWEKEGGVDPEHWDKILEVLGVDVRDYESVPAQAISGGMAAGPGSAVVHAADCFSVNVQGHPAEMIIGRAATTPSPTGDVAEGFPVTLTRREYEFFLALRRYGSPAMVEEWMSVLDQVRSLIKK